MFVKIFEQIYDSSLSEDYLTRLVFQDFLILSDAEGVVDMTPESIARRTNVPIDVVRAGIRYLEQPDQRSRSKEQEGRRIARIDDHRDWGWRIVNYQKYREIRSTEDRKTYQRDYYRQNRSKAAKRDRSQQPSTSLNTPQHTQPNSTKAEAEAEVLKPCASDDALLVSTADRKTNSYREEWFEEFWEIFWVKKGKAKAREVFRRHATTEEIKNQILAAVRAQKTEMLARLSVGGTPKWAEGWLNSKRYLDDANVYQANPPKEGYVDAYRLG